MAEEQVMSEGATITPNNNGPYHVRGSFTIVLPSGRELQTEGETWLCRCGGSSNKPFCDGTHRKIGFKAAEVVEEVEAAPAEAAPAEAAPAAATQPAVNGAAGDWVAVADAGSIGEDELLGVQVDGEPVVIGRVDGELYAIGGVCTHEHALLEDGELEGDIVACPLHDSGFNIRTGQAVRFPAVLPVPRYAVKVEDGRVLVSRAPSEAGSR
jgi:nitrite reductase/ring-hydroxylating ferredoxin subunit/CDGSH-type Zn-finger protein